MGAASSAGDEEGEEGAAEEFLLGPDDAGRAGDEAVASADDDASALQAVSASVSEMFPSATNTPADGGGTEAPKARNELDVLGNRTDIARAGGVESLIAMLRAPRPAAKDCVALSAMVSASLRSESLRSLAHLSHKTESNRVLIAREGGLRPILDALRHCEQVVAQHRAHLCPKCGRCRRRWRRTS